MFLYKRKKLLYCIRDVSLYIFYFFFYFWFGLFYYYYFFLLVFILLCFQNGQNHPFRVHSWRRIWPDLLISPSHFLSLSFSLDFTHSLNTPKIWRNKIVNTYSFVFLFFQMFYEMNQKDYLICYHDKYMSFFYLEIVCFHFAWNLFKNMMLLSFWNKCEHFHTIFFSTANYYMECEVILSPVLYD